jgi:hypothetical protein
MQNFTNGNHHHVTWREADKSWLKAKGRSVRSILDSTQREDGVGRYVAATVATIAIASVVGLSGVFAGPDIAGKALTSSLNPLGIVESITGSPGSASAQALQECGPVAADASIETEDGNTEAGGSVEVSFDPDNVTPPAPEDFVLVPPVLIGDDSDDDGDDGPNDDGSDDPNDDPNDPNDDGNDDPGGSNLVGADINLLGEDVMDIGLLDGNLLGVGVNSLDPDGSGTGTGIDVNLQDDDLADVGVDPQGDEPVDIDLNGEDVLDQELLNGTGVDDAVGTVTGDGGGLLDGLLGEDPLGGLLGGDPLGGLLN